MFIALSLLSTSISTFIIWQPSAATWLLTQEDPVRFITFKLPSELLTSHCKTGIQRRAMIELLKYAGTPLTNLPLMILVLNKSYELSHNGELGFIRKRHPRIPIFLNI